MILPFLVIIDTKSRGRGVFTSEDIPAGTIVEVAPVIVMPSADRSLLDQTRLHDYIFEWGSEGGLCCMALGYVAMYNHAYASNCEYEMDLDDELIRITAVRDIARGEELYINYNGNWNDPKKLWFDAV